MWKFAGDTTVSEIVLPSKQSALQQAVDFISTWSQDNRLQLSPSKCKQLRSYFKSSPPTHSPVELDGFVFERVNSAFVSQPGYMYMVMLDCKSLLQSLHYLDNINFDDVHFLTCYKLLYQLKVLQQATQYPCLRVVTHHSYSHCYNICRQVGV